MRSYLKVAEICYHSLDSCWGVLHKLLDSFWVILLQVTLETVHKNRTVNCLVCIYTITGKKYFKWQYYVPENNQVATRVKYQIGFTFVASKNTVQW